jgi:hypothetical protein
MLETILITATLAAAEPPADELLRNYAAKLNEPTLAIPEEQRAWPVYVRALAVLEGHEAAAGIDLGDIDEAERRQAALELSWRAASMEHLGFVLQNADDPVFGPVRAAREKRPWEPREPAANPYLIVVLLSHLAVLTDLAREVRQDLASTKDPQRVVQNVRTLLGMARHAREQPMIITELAAAQMIVQTLDQLLELLATDPGALDDESLRALAGTVGSVDTRGRLDLALRTDGYMIADLIQRIYPPDPEPDDQLSEEGAYGLAALILDAGPHEPEDIDRLAPVLRVMVARHSGIVEEKRRIFELLHRQAQLNLWDDELVQIQADIDERLSDGNRFVPIAVNTPCVSSAVLRLEWAAQLRDAALVAIALELHRRGHGEYPESLDALVPEFLGRIPRDVFDGGPIKYRLVEPGPIVYSIGPNRRDNGGTPPLLHPPIRGRWTLSVAQAPRADEDWVLFPPPYLPED